jgi:nitrogen-specific signal transduction histidine kinase/ActR/RegA family two-component response regulator
MAGRIEALLSAWIIVVVYLRELDYLARATEDQAQKLRQAERMESLGKLTGGIAHDFNNLLTVVVGAFELIKLNPDAKTRVAEMASHGLTAADRGAKLTAQLLAFARRQALRPEVLNINLLLRGYDGLLRRAAGDACTVTFESDPLLHPVYLDGSQLESCLLNLVVNARDAMPAGGVITLKTQNLILDEASARDVGIDPGKYAQITVTDTGVGMPPEVAAHAFEPFFSTKDVGQGTGLGLSQVYGFVKSSNGHIDIRSQPGAGTTVRMLLPACEGVVLPQRETVAPPLSITAASGERVLVVEDDLAVARSALEALQELGYRAIVAASANEALDILKSPEPVDILFSDVVMPGGMNGVQLAVEAQRLRPGVRVLLTSGYSHPVIQDRSLLNVPILNKPYRPDDLARNLRSISAAGQTASGRT